MRFNSIAINKQPFLYILAGILVGVPATILVFYLTPLKNLNLVEPKIKNVSPAAFYEAHQKSPEDYIFIDVRPSAVYNREHAEGSINIPLHMLYTERNYLPQKDQTIVLICSGGSASGVAYGYLEHYGFLNLRRLEGGIEAWKQAGLPVVTNP